MGGDSHAISYLLDPRYLLGSDMTPERRVEVEEFIFNQPASRTEPPSTAQSQDALSSDYTNCQIAAQEMKQQNSTVYCMIKVQKLSMLKFWLSRGDVWLAKSAETGKEGLWSRGIEHSVREKLFNIWFHSLKALQFPEPIGS